MDPGRRRIDRDVRVVGAFLPSEIDGAVLNVPSLPSHDRLYVTAPPPPEVRVKVYVRV